MKKQQKLKKLEEKIKHHFKSGACDYSAIDIRNEIWDIFYPKKKRKMPLRFNKVGCQFSEEGMRVFKKQFKGHILGESRDGRCWRVKKSGKKTTDNYAKYFIELTQ